LKIIFAGTPEFARTALVALHLAGHEIALVLTQPDRPAGRGLKLKPSLVKEYALRNNMPIAQPRSLKLDGTFLEEAQQAKWAIQNAQAQLMVVVAYGLILPKWVLETMHGPTCFGCFNIHGSLLPRWRGAAPIHRAIEAGDTQSGISITQMDEGLDTGDLLLKKAVSIESSDTTASLHDRLARLGADLIVQTLEMAASQTLVPQPQATEGVVYAHKINKEESLIDWRLPAALIERRVRAFNPSPGAVSVFMGESFKIWQAIEVPAPKIDQIYLPGTVVSVGPEGVTVATGKSQLLIKEVQRAGAKKMLTADFLRGTKIQIGHRFGSEPV